MTTLHFDGLPSDREHESDIAAGMLDPSAFKFSWWAICSAPHPRRIISRPVTVRPAPDRLSGSLGILVLSANCQGRAILRIAGGGVLG